MGTPLRSTTSAACRGASSTTTPRWRWRGCSVTAPASRTRVFSELQSHDLFDDRVGRPGKGNDNGTVEGLVGDARRNFFVPVPRVASGDAVNLDVANKCPRAARAPVPAAHRDDRGALRARPPGVVPVAAGPV